MDTMNAMDRKDSPDLHAQLCAAITRRSLVMFEYGDLIRVVEPHRYGLNSAGHPMLSGWLRAGYSRSDPAGGWRNYLLSEMHALQVLDAPFAGTRPGYAAHDHRMPEVYAELTPSSMEVPVEGPYVVREPMPPSAAAPPDVAAPAARAGAADATMTHDEAEPPDASR
jgi:hypothetical protein